MFKIKIITIGKTKEKWLNLAIAEYEKRLSNSCKIELICLKDQDELEKSLTKEHNYICLDLNGENFSSIEFSKFLINELEEQKSKLAFVIGGSEGLSVQIKQRAMFSISLSKLTFTHQMSRLILLEQIYRSLEIEKGSHYHK